MQLPWRKSRLRQMNESAAVAFFSCASRTRFSMYLYAHFIIYLSERARTHTNKYIGSERAERRKKKSFSTKVRGCAPARDFPCHALHRVASAKEYYIVSARVSSGSFFLDLGHSQNNNNNHIMRELSYFIYPHCRRPLRSLHQAKECERIFLHNRRRRHLSARHLSTSLSR
jgi:hypothetical protein